MSSRDDPPRRRLSRRPRDLYKDELLVIVERLVHTLHGVPDENGELPDEHELPESALAELHRVLADYGLRSSENPPIEFELALLRTAHNEPLSESAKGKIRAAYEWPCDRTWHAAHGVTVSTYGASLWELIQELDSTFPLRKPTARKAGRRPPWPRVPTSAQIRQALLHAIATAPVLDSRDDPGRRHCDDEG